MVSEKESVSAPAPARSASEPDTISMISVVIASWRARFITRLKLVISSSALSVAAFSARWRAVCSEAAAHRVDLVVAIAEVALRLSADEDERVVTPPRYFREQCTFGLADHRGVVGARQTTVGGDNDEGHPPDLRPGIEQRAVAGATT